ncbi:hypothetical protein CXF83_15370 [Shewanella sp. Choline-02u-19]|jgi:hypothetical protein|uniref:DUF4250 domain-containing protein n=1 Tax=unclassified Shewanella TaxID=196818 RepID=UPI000C3229B2|nr:MULTISPECIES: DUF4250 domain-containing protein [unclassified Shewanella]PKG56240.1 hypothetical protein CXF82_15775 [Shewanella sp. GutDb-MelDb]PKG75642.1 hypothetical protein CXF86_06400 [Shewanella sp. GutCb]PKH56500.1 hypothetical protein CXF84_12975 [Shewanella sp. Bg11-22]PKI27994.1 hypothetical protein CXF83_15370 [Shewanella sp. Choline-02u-19]
MDITHLEQLSAETLLGIVNEKLRLTCADQAALFYELDIDKRLLESKLADIGFHYSALSNQYRNLK